MLASVAKLSNIVFPMYFHLFTPCGKIIANCATVVWLLLGHSQMEGG